MDAEANRIIDALGGTTEVARLCECNPQAVSHWRRDGIPKARRLFLKFVRPELFEEQVAASQMPTEAGA